MNNEQNIPAANDLIIDATDASFMSDVIDASMQMPVIVDFWAPWCEPCKQLTPILENLVSAAKGAIRLVKINMDENQMVAQQLQIRSIPAVYAFHQGQPIDGFMGALPESEIKSFIDKLLALNGAPPPDAQELNQAATLDEIKTNLNDMRVTNQWNLDLLRDWQNQLSDMLAAKDVGTDDALVCLMGQICLDAVDVDIARSILQMRLGELGEQESKPLESLKNRLALIDDEPKALQNLAMPVPDKLTDADYQLYYDEARALAAIGKMQEAADILLSLMAQSRDMLDDGARKYLLTMMASLQAFDPRIALWRKKLSALVFS